MFQIYLCIIHLPEAPLRGIVAIFRLEKRRDYLRNAIFVQHQKEEEKNVNEKPLRKKKKKRFRDSNPKPSSTCKVDFISQQRPNHSESEALRGNTEATALKGVVREESSHTHNEAKHFPEF